MLQETIASARHYKEGTGMWNISDLDNAPSRLSMSVSMYRGGGGGGFGRPKTAPPDLPSLLLDSRICYLGMPVCFHFSRNGVKTIQFVYLE